MNNLEQKKIAFKLKEDDHLPILVSVPLDDSQSELLDVENDFLDLTIDMKKDHVLVGKVVYHNPIEGIMTVEVEQPQVSIELDADLFEIEVL